MPLRPRDIDIDPADPFKEDKLARKARVESLCGLVTSDPEPVVVAVDGKFGSGKSTFLKLCAAHLRHQNQAVVVEFNAWQQSHTDNPLVDLTSALAAQVSYGKKLQRIAAQIGWNAVSAVTKGVIEHQTFRVSNHGSVSARWNDIETQRQAFRDELTSIVEKEGRVVVLLDELDRCMPQQALDYLNVVRHLFDVAGVAVVIGVNQDELAHRVKQLYGKGCDADTYLRRFWDLPLPLSEPDSTQLTNFLNGVYDGADLSSRFDNSLYWRLLINQSGMSLRDVQQMVHHLAGFLGRHSGRNQTLEDLVLAVYVLRTIDRNAYNKLISGERSLVETAASFREKLDLNLDPSLDRDFNDEGFLRRYLIALVLCMDFRESRNVKDGSFIERFVEAGVGTEEQAKAIQEECEGVRSPLIDAMATRERIDSLLHLMA